MRPVRTPPPPCPPSLIYSPSFLSIFYTTSPYPLFLTQPTRPSQHQCTPWRESIHGFVFPGSLIGLSPPGRCIIRNQGFVTLDPALEVNLPFSVFLLPAPNHQSSHIPPTPSDWLTAPTHHYPTTTRTSRSACHYHGSQICVFRVVILITLAWRPSKLVGLRPVRQGDTVRGDAPLSLPVPR